MHPLAIVIPAFKPNFFRAALTSVAAQTDRRFQLYVGNDGGPEEIGDVCADFPALDIRYKRYADNLGGTSLAGHWNRCIAATREPWIWLFSDDDVMSPECVAAVHDRIADFESGDVLRFNTKIIGSSGETLREYPPHPPHETGTEFLMDRLIGARSSFAVEYVFRRGAWERAEGFADYPVAWCADDVSWFRFSRRGGITTLDRGTVSWRASGMNITDANRAHQEEKLEASSRFLGFVRTEVRPSLENVRPPEEWDRAEEAWFESQVRYLMPLSPRLCLAAVRGGPESWRARRIRTLLRIAPWNVVSSFRWLRGVVRRLVRR